MCNQNYKQIFKLDNNPNRPTTRTFNSDPFFLQPARTVHYGHDGYLEYKIWNLIPENIKQKQSTSDFKETIKSWIPLTCPCRICQNYICDVGYITTHDQISNCKFVKWDKKLSINDLV